MGRSYWHHVGDQPPIISFYRAKHGGLSLGASPFHAPVGQAQKNLGRMTLPEAAMVAKYASWDQVYRHGGVRTAIQRAMRGGDVAAIQAAVDDTRAALVLLKRVFIVTSSLSRQAVANVFEAAMQGVAPSPHFVQLYRLLTTYFAACAKMGATGYVICQE